MPKLTPEKHAEHLANKFKELAVDKYMRGHKKYGTLLWEADVLDLLYNAREEFIDGFVYIQTAIDAVESQR